MREWMIGTALAAMALAVQPAHAASNLECIDDGYTAQQEEIFADYFRGFTVESLEAEADDASGSLIPPISDRAAHCTLEHGWSQQAILNAIIFRMSVLLAAALEVKTPLTPDQMAGLEEALAKADRARLRAILGPGIEASIKGEPEPEMSEDDKTYLGMIVLAAGLPTDQGFPEYVGALLGARMMAEIAAEKFAES